MGKVLIILLLLLASCYNERKAQLQLGRAVTSFPKIGADYCSRVFPPHDSTVHDTLSTTDTLIVEGASHSDTVTINDTVRITTTVQLPGHVITNTVTIRDTIYQTNTAAIEACRIDNSRLVATIQPITADRDKYKKRSRTYFWILLVMGAIIGVGIYSKLAGLFKPKI